MLLCEVAGRQLRYEARVIESSTTSRDETKVHCVKSLASILLITTYWSLVTSSSAQGPLTPPGAPAPTMKTLPQVEPRTAITNAGSFTISAPGSYYLTTNLTITAADGITITCSNVTLDLNGFAILSTTSAPFGGSAVLLAGKNRQIRILNGSIRRQKGIVDSGNGFAVGINYTGGEPGEPEEVLVTDVSVSDCISAGIQLGSGISAVESCSVEGGGSSVGVLASRVSKTISIVSGLAIFGTIVTECRGISTNSEGISAGVVQNCFGSGLNNGIYANTAENCIGSSQSGIGVNVNYSASDCVGTSQGVYPGVKAANAINCKGTGIFGAGLSAETAMNCTGTSTTSNGIECVITATGCYGYTSASNAIGLSVVGTANACGGGNAGGGTAIKAAIGIGCTTYGGTNNIPPANKFLGTP